jgi:molecular chaperone GrpE
VEDETAAGAAAPDELTALRRERDDLREQLLRRRAEFENFKKRVERDRSQAGFEAAAAVFRELVPTVDNLERALASGAEEHTLRQGVELTHRELLTFLEGQGVEVHDPVGRPFDPRIHQALMHEAVPGSPEGTVVEVFRKGYAYKDRLLRPALVKVAKAGEPSDGQEGDGGIH